MKAKLIEDRIDALFPNGNFYFFKIFKGSDRATIERNELEQKELQKLITDCMESKKYYITSGLLEPIHLQENERDLLVEGM